MRPELVLRLEIAISAILPLLVLGFVPRLPVARRYTKPLIFAVFVLYGIIFVGLAMVLQPGPDKRHVLWAEVVCGLLLVLQSIGLLARKRIYEHPGSPHAVRLARRAQIVGTLIRVILLIVIVAALFGRASI